MARALEVVVVGRAHAGDVDEQPGELRAGHFRVVLVLGLRDEVELHPLWCVEPRLLVRRVDAFERVVEGLEHAFCHGVDRSRFDKDLSCGYDPGTMARVQRIELLRGPLDGKSIPIRCDERDLPRVIYAERFSSILSGIGIFSDTRPECFYGTDQDGCVRYRAIKSTSPWLLRYVWAP